MPSKILESSEVFFSEELSNDNPIKAPEISHILKGIAKSRRQDVAVRDENKKFMDTLHEFVDCKAKMDAKCEDILKANPLLVLGKEFDADDFELPSNTYNSKYQQQSVSGQPVKGLADLYEAAKQVLPIFSNQLEETVQAFRQSVGGEQEKIVLEVAELKDAARAMEKAKEDYGDRQNNNLSSSYPSPASWLYDIVRASIVFSSSEQLLSFVEETLTEEKFAAIIVQSKNRFQRPAFSGYRDWCLHIQIDTGLGFHHVCELQLHYQPIKDLSEELGSYAHYQQLRFYFGKNAKYDMEDRIEDLKAIVKGKRYHFSMLDSMLEDDTADLDRLQRLADLFHHRLGEYEIAAKLESQLLLNAKVCDVADSYENIGSILLKMEQDHQHEDAKMMHVQALQLRLETLGKRHKSVASSYFHLGLVLEKQGQHYSAMNMHKEALCIRIEALGKNHPLVVASYNQIGIVWESLARYEDAKKMYQKALQIRSETLGEKDVSVATSHSNIGSILEFQNKNKEALESHEKALAIRREVFGNRHRSVPYSLNKIGGILKELEKYEEAKAMHQEALDIQLEMLGDDTPPNPAVASSYNNLGAIFLRQGQYKEAQSMHEKALEIRLETLGENHTSVANSYSTLGVILAKQHQYEEGRIMHERALRIRLQALGEKNVSVASSYHCLGVVLEKQGEYKEAEYMHKRALEIRTEILGEEHSTVQTSSRRLQSVLEKQMEEDEFSSSESSSSSFIRSSYNKVRSVLKKSSNKQQQSSSPLPKETKVRFQLQAME